MAVRIAINGFGRIGRLVLRALVENGRDDLIPVVINDLGSIEANAHLFRYDSVHGRFPGQVTIDGDSLSITCNGRRFEPIRVCTEKDPAKLPFGGIDVAMECTGHFTRHDAASQLIDAGARKVLVSAPCDGADATIVYGVNEKTITADMAVVSNASCTTNCLAPMVKILQDAFGIELGYMVTIHAYTGDQNTIDTLHKDLRRARAAAVSMIPTSTGAAKSIGLVIPELKGKLDGAAVRVPTPDVSLVSLDLVLETRTIVQEINQAMEVASLGSLRGILDYNTEKLVSVDFCHTAASCIFDATQTTVLGGRFAHIVGWYDNEWGFSCRMLDTAALLGRL